MDAPEVKLAAVDYALIVLYMLALIGIGLYYRKFASKSIENFFLGGRRMRGWMTGTSYAVTCMNAEVGTVYCGITVASGMFICWWYFSRFGLCMMIAAILFAVFWRRLRIFTSPEFYELRFSGNAALTVRSWVTVRSAFIAVVAWTGSGLVGLSKVFSELLGWSKFETLLIVIPVILFYVLLSGYVGVVVSDLLQTLILTVSMITLMGAVWIEFGGPVGLHGALVAAFPNNPSVVSWHPPMNHAFLGLVGVMAWTFGTSLGYGGDVAPVAGAMEGQRLLSCRNAREASKMYIWTIVMLFIMLAVMTLPALGALAKWPELYNAPSAERELVFGRLLGAYLPPGLLGLAVIAMFASIMSTVDSNMNFGAQVFVNDIYKRSLAPRASMGECLFVGKVVMFVILGLAILVATIAETVIGFSVFMLQFSCAEMSANWGQWWWWRFNAKARLAASFGGPIIFLINRFVLFRHLVNRGIVSEDSSAYLIVFASILGTTVLWLIVSLATKPDPEEKLIEFYKRARPMGWWGPIAEKAGKEDTRGLWPILVGFGVAVLGLVMIASGILAIHGLYLGQTRTVVATAIVALTSGYAFKRAYAAYMRRLGVPEAEDDPSAPAEA
ncbi:MAG TPA: hypothetical protein VM492_01820 [Sumerlaeia bacterium]|nr:hypothetical protein [Sumerlaeia bacterium]